VTGNKAVFATTALSDGGTLIYDAAFFALSEADALFDTLCRETAWKQEVGRGRPFPRLTAWYADDGLIYRYSGVTHVGNGWTPTLSTIKQRIEEAAAASFNSVLLNRYRSGRDSIGMHADDEAELGANPVVASVSLGSVRTFVLKHRASGAKRALALAHGSLLVMGGTCQHHWLHGVPKTELAVGERINLTFRSILVPTLRVGTHAGTLRVP
jgi:alkylated DNA repair dioxygenase AlkB